MTEQTRVTRMYRVKPSDSGRRIGMRASLTVPSISKDFCDNFSEPNRCHLQVNDCMRVKFVGWFQCPSLMLWTPDRTPNPNGFGRLWNNPFRSRVPFDPSYRPLWLRCVMWIYADPILAIFRMGRLQYCLERVVNGLPSYRQVLLRVVGEIDVGAVGGCECNVAKFGKQPP